MSFLHCGKKYKPGHKWSKPELLAVTTKKIVCYIKRKVYGDKGANPDKNPPVHHCKNSVLL